MLSFHIQHSHFLKINPSGFYRRITIQLRESWRLQAESYDSIKIEEVLPQPPKEINKKKAIGTNINSYFRKKV